MALAARPRAATPVFVDGGRRARLLRLVGHLIALVLSAWIALTAVALVGPQWADGLPLRSDRAVSHLATEPDASPTRDDTADEAPLFTSVPTDDDTTDDGPGSGLLGPTASEAPSASASEASAPVTHLSPDAQDRAGAAAGDGPVPRPR